MGFEIMIEIEAGGTSSKVNQFDEDGKVGGQISGSGGACGLLQRSTTSTPTSATHVARHGGSSMPTSAA